MKVNISDFLIQKGACSNAIEWSKQYNDNYELAWNSCDRGDYLLWIARKIGVSLERLTLAKALCAYTVRHLMRDKRSKEAVYVAFKFGRGKATTIELNSAASAAYAAAASAAYAAAASAAYAAAVAAAYAAAVAAAYAAAVAADAADAAVAIKDNKLKTANICRKILTEEVFRIIGEESKNG